MRRSAHEKMKCMGCRCCAADALAVGSKVINSRIGLMNENRHMEACKSNFELLYQEKVQSSSIGHALDCYT